MKRINHKLLGGDFLEGFPQRKPNKGMTGDQLLMKAVTGTHIKKTERQIKDEEILKIINKKK